MKLNALLTSMAAWILSAMFLPYIYSANAEESVDAPRELDDDSESLEPKHSGASFVTSGPGRKPYDLIGDGKRIELKDKGLSIVPPIGWEVFTSHPNLTLLMQVPYDKSLKYQRTIQVASFSGPRYMDDLTAKEFAELITRKFSQLSVSIEGYRIRNRVPVEMADGREGMLFYSEFRMYGIDLMQAHILVSSASRHYLMTFTDVAEHFEREDISHFLTEAWESMTSAELDGRSPARFEAMVMMGVGAGILIALLAGVLILRSWRAGKRYQQFERSQAALEDSQEIDSYEPYPLTGTSAVTDLDHSELESTSDSEEVSIQSKQAKDSHHAHPSQQPRTSVPPAKARATPPPPPAAPGTSTAARPRPPLPRPPGSNGRAAPTASMDSPRSTQLPVPPGSAAPRSDAQVSANEGLSRFEEDDDDDIAV